MAGGKPAISGVELAELLEADGWAKGRRCKHGTAYHKQFSDEARTTIIPNKSESLPPGTLSAILSSRQTGLGRSGLLRLLGKDKKCR